MGNRKLLDVRAHVSMVFHLDKCIGCHTCSVACKNVWTDRAGAEYMWWNNVETKPGTGYPTRWEDQEHHRGGWALTPKGELALKSHGRLGGLLKTIFNPVQPTIDDYYEPWSYRYRDLFDAPEGGDQPTAVPVSQLTGEVMDIEAGPNWDDDLSGSPVYARNDVNLAALTEEERRMLFEVEGIAMAYLPRICNHCVNPACVAACPSGAIYKRGEDGVVLINQDACRGWRACVGACPYKKIYFNWQTGKSEKCILCYPRLETGQPPACFHSCVGRIRYMGVMLYDAGRLTEALAAADASLVESIRSVLLDPSDPAVRAAAARNGVSAEMLDCASRSPIWKWVGEWQLALPLHPEYRTLPMLFYVPPLLPVVGRLRQGLYEHDGADLGATLRQARLPLKYLARLFTAGNVPLLEGVLMKLAAVRAHQRSKQIGSAAAPGAERLLRDAGLTPETAEAIYRMSSLVDPKERYVLPPIQREQALHEDAEGQGGPECQKGACGLGCGTPPRREA